MVLFPKPYTIIRQAKGKYQNGAFIPSTSTTLTIMADIQPYSATEKIEPSNIGRKEDGTIKIFTDDQIIYTIEGDYQKPDYIIFENRSYEIVRMEEHRSGILDYTMYIAELRTGAV